MSDDNHIVRPCLFCGKVFATFGDSIAHEMMKLYRQGFGVNFDVRLTAKGEATNRAAEAIAKRDGVDLFNGTREERERVFCEAVREVAAGPKPTAATAEGRPCIPAHSFKIPRFASLRPGERRTR